MPRELEPNIPQVANNGAQAQQLLETGEIDLYLSPDTRGYALARVRHDTARSGMVYPLAFFTLGENAMAFV